MDSENEIIVMGHDAEYEGKCNLLNYFSYFLNTSVSFYFCIDEFQDMVVEEYEEESNGEVLANNDETYSSSVYFIDLRIDDMKRLLYFFIDLWPVAATKLLIAIRGPMSAEFEKIKKKGKKNRTLANNCQQNDI